MVEDAMVVFSAGHNQNLLELTLFSSLLYSFPPHHLQCLKASIEDLHSVNCIYTTPFVDDEQCNACLTRSYLYAYDTPLLLVRASGLSPNRSIGY